MKLHAEFSVPFLVGWGCSSVGRASDRHAADAESIPRCGKGFFSQSQLSVKTLLRCPRVQSQVLTSVRTLKIPLSMSRVRWTMTELNQPACTVGRVCDSVAAGFPRGKQPDFAIGDIPTGQYSCKKKLSFCFFVF